MANYSDHKKPYNDINAYLPEVYKSDVNRSVFDTAFNRHMTKDDTARVAGFIGEGNPQALRDRQITEQTPHRQAFQLAPTMFTTVGTVENALSFKAFQGQLELMGVNIDRMDKWGNALQFNWVPPVNLDMIVNYQDYFWRSANPSDPAQYFTIENRCNKALSKVESYNNMLTLRGGSFPIISVGYASDQFVVSNKLDDLFIDGFIFYTDTTTNPNLLNKQWTVASSTYNLLTNETTITVVESIANAGPVAPVPSFLYQWWYDTGTSSLNEWDGSAWVLAVQAQAVNIDLTRTLTIYQYEANCVCNQSYGWDTTEWDLNDGAQWDTSVACVSQELNQWSSQNQWIHKTQVQSFADVKRAQMPILEYSSAIELNEWTEVIPSWKYRVDADQPFAQTATQSRPSRFELEPIKGFSVANISGKWVITLFDQLFALNRDINLVNVFVPGFKFRVTDDTNASTVYTVAVSEYRETTPGSKQMQTVVTLEETVYTSQINGGGPLRARIEPVTTSLGDTWRGYHVHWVVDQDATSFVPASSRALNPFLRDGLDSPSATVPIVPSVHVDDGLPFTPVNGSIALDVFFQEIILNTAGVTRIDLVDQFRCIDGVTTAYGTPNSNQVRVYLNDVRQYASYTEVVGVADSSTFSLSDFYTVVGQATQTSQNITYVRAVVFNAPLAQYDVVRIEVGPAALEDMGSYAVPVRTIEDEVLFTLATVNGTQPAYIPVSKYIKQEQSKRIANQYPLFNVYDVITSEVVKATPLFQYREGSSYPINTLVGMRIAADIPNKQFEFEQSLLDRDDNILYGFRSPVGTYQFWYNPNLKTVKYWDGRAWSTNIPVVVSGRLAYRTAFIEPYAPTGVTVLPSSYWFNTLTNLLYQYNGSSWVLAPTPTIVATDPTLQTIWKHGNNNEQYVPAYVDANRSPIAIGSPLGDWEVVDQWRYNPEHENKQHIKFSQLVTHFKSILTSQPSVPGLQGGGIYTLTQADINYGLGGTIKEHNDSYDALISAVNVKNVSPTGAIEFANQQYGTCQVFVRDFFNKSLERLLTSYTQLATSDLEKYVADEVIAQYETNDFTAQIYSDTTAYDPATGKGVQNWVATVPMMGLGPVYRPHLTVADGRVQLFHHDGHRSDVVYSGVEYDKYSRAICNLDDPRASGSKFGKIVTPSTPLPSTGAGLTTHLGYLRPTLYWYSVGSGSRTLYRFNAYAVGGSAPSFYYENGDTIPDGVMYFNTAALAVYEKVGLSWVPITGIGADDITPLWEEIDFAQLYGTILLEVEQRLYDVTPNAYVAFDYATLTPTPEEQTEYDRLLRGRFSTFLTTYGITTPFSNSEYTPQNAFTWNYTSSTMLTPPRLDITPATPACWQELYTRWYGTPYPHLEPWVLQGFHDKPTWWDEQYLDTTGARRWIYTHSTTTGMWQNIRVGTVPAGRTYPNGALSTGNTLADGQTLPTYQYFSVNISDGTISGGYPVDSLLPPYYDNTAIALSLPTVRSMYTTYTSEITAPDADYTFGDVGPTEWAWTVSSQYPYDNPVIAFLMQPVKFFHSSFGVHFTNVDLLQVDVLSKQVYSHEDVLFHGDIYDTNKVFSAPGLNQWYVNYNRFTGTDTNGEFRELWASWNPRLTYQFGGIIDTGTFEISNQYFDVIDQDYEIILANNGVIDSLWLDAFEISLLSIPPARVQYNNQAAWKMEIDNLSTTARDIMYYGVKSYQFTADSNTDTCTAFKFLMLSANGPARRFTIGGDYTSVFLPDTPITVTDSPWNNGVYTVTSSAFETSTNRTRINVAEPIAVSNAAGYINLNKSLPWQTGDEVVISSSKFVPAPLFPDTSYFVIRLTAKTFKLAETKEDALNAIAIDLTSMGEGTLMISQLDSSFQVFGGQGNTTDQWYHYAIDTSDIRSFSPPYTILGMQTLINLVDGYAAYKKQEGVLLNIADDGNFDPDTGRLVSWEVETERFIDWAYGLRQARIAVSDRYPASVNISTNTLTFGAAVPMWLGGTAVNVISTGDLPAPLIDGAAYYVVNTGTSGVIQLSSSANPSDLLSIIDLTTLGTGQLTVGLFNKNRAYPRFEINPTRNHMWVDTPLGVLSNVVTGPYADIRVNQTIFDQYSRLVGPDKITVYRQDERSHIAIRSEIPNDVDPIYSDDPYNYIHMGGAHLFVEGYEHFLVFNDYTVGGALIYDPFFGLQANKFAVDYFEKEQYTLRPTLGGYYLLDQEFKRNIEGSASDMKNYYDVMELSESSSVAQRSRALLGYKGRTDYLDFLNINSKSQFMFYRGMIQTKGSVNSVTAYINSRRFIDARVDDFWAWKVAEFGDSRQRVYPEVKLFAVDGALDDVRLEFLAESETALDEDVIDATYKGFQIVSFKDESRWNIYPEQKGIIKSPLFLDTAVSSLITVHSSVTPPPPGTQGTITYWYNTDINTLYTYNVITSRWDIAEVGRVFVQSANISNLATTDYVYFRLDAPCDAVRVIRKAITSSTLNVATTVAPSTFTIVGDKTNEITVGVPIGVTGSTTLLGSNDGYYYPSNVTFDGVNTIVVVEELTVEASVTPGFIVVEDFATYALEVYNQGDGLREVQRVDSEVIRFQLNGFQDVLQIFILNAPSTRLSPAKLLDVKSNTVVQQIPMWDPARGLHSHVAIHNVDLQSKTDPARYQFTPNPNDAEENFWNLPEVGTVWLETAALGYLPYYDDKIYPDVNDRLYNWGKLAPWGAVKVYQWVSSPVPPEQWDARVVQQAGNPLIQQNDKATGTPRTTVFKRVRTATAVTSINVSPANTITTPISFAAGDQVLFTAATLPDGLESGVKYIVASTGTTFGLLDPNTEDPVQIGPNAGASVLIVPAYVTTDWNIQSVIRDHTNAPYIAQLVRSEAGTVTPVTWPYTLPQVPVGLGFEYRIYWTPASFSSWVTGSGTGSDRVDVYVNGVLYATGLPVSPDGGNFYVTVPDPVTFNESDLIDIVRPIHDVTPAEAEFNPDVEDDGTQMIQWKADYQYCTQTFTVGGTNVGSVTQTNFYFWVENATNSNPSVQADLSVFEVAQQIETIPTPYFVVQRPKDDPYLVERYGYGMIQYGSVFSSGILTEADYQIPVLYREAIIRKVASYIDDDNRYVVRFTRDWALRDDLQANGRQVNLKNKHDEWFMFRKSQTNVLPRQLWDRLTESLTGYKLPSSRTVTVLDQPLSFTTVGQTLALGNTNVSGLYLDGLEVGVDYTVNELSGTVTLISATKFPDPAPFRTDATYTYTVTVSSTARVPSLERELYDSLYGTDTQYGLGEDQTFVNKTLALATIIAYLSDPAKDFSPIDIDTFFANNNFNTPADIISTMDLIYTSFNATHVNAIWFETLLDALSTRAKYKELMKTSWIALHGIRVLEVGGLFDD